MFGGRTQAHSLYESMLLRTTASINHLLPGTSLARDLAPTPD